MTEEQNNLDSSPLLTAGVTLGAGGLGAKYVYDTHMNNMATDKVVEILKEQADLKNVFSDKKHNIVDKKYFSQANKIEALHAAAPEGEKTFLSSAYAKKEKAVEKLAEIKDKVANYTTDKLLPKVDNSKLPKNEAIIKKATEAVEKTEAEILRTKASGVVKNLELTKDEAFIARIEHAVPKAGFIAAIGGLGIGAAAYFAKQAATARPKSFAEREMQRRGGQNIPEVS